MPAKPCSALGSPGQGRGEPVMAKARSILELVLLKLPELGGIHATSLSLSGDLPAGYGLCTKPVAISTWNAFSVGLGGERSTRLIIFPLVSHTQ